MRTRFLVLPAAVLASLLLGACSSGHTARAAAVEIKLIAFKPDHLTVAGGTTVTWRQRDPGVHTVTSGTVHQLSGGVQEVPDGTFDSGELATGKTFARKFSAPGTFSYFCHIHPATMRGEITVT